MIDCAVAKRISHVTWILSFLGLAIVSVVAMVDFWKTEDSDEGTGKFMKIMLHPASIGGFGAAFVLGIVMSALAESKCGVATAAEELISSSLSLDF